MKWQSNNNLVVEQLKNTIMFSSFKDRELSHLQEMTHVIHLKSGDTLFQQGQDFKCFYFVNEGIVKLSRFSENGTEKVIELIRQKQYFAEALVFMKSPSYPVMATAMQDCELIAINAKNYAALLHKSVDACFNLLASMSQRIHSLVNDIDALTLHSSKSRLASYLVNCLEHTQEKNNSFDLELPKGVIASRLSMKPETFSRALHKLDESGIISVAKRQVTVNDEQALLDIANQEHNLKNI